MKRASKAFLKALERMREQERNAKTEAPAMPPEQPGICPGCGCDMSRPKHCHDLKCARMGRSRWVRTTVKTYRNRVNKELSRSDYGPGDEVVVMPSEDAAEILEVLSLVDGETMLQRAEGRRLAARLLSRLRSRR